MTSPWAALTGLSLLSWLYLIFGRGGFWRARERLPRRVVAPGAWPEVVAVVPARNEADVIGRSLASILAQDYPGALSVVIVDDGSDDGTVVVARDTAQASTTHVGRAVHIESGTALPPGWVGKMWAVAQGVRRAEEVAPDAASVWLTDADIEHAPDELRRLVAKSACESLDLASLMVKLHCHSPVERLLIPAFVFFFQKLYPFGWANDRRRREAAAAAGGSMLVRRTALERIGGIAAIKGELIDDCALAARVKLGGAIWIGLAETTRSLRPYPGLKAIWLMVARTAFNQLRYSRSRLVATLLGLAVVYGVPPLALASSPLHSDTAACLAAAAASALMLVAYAPTLRLYGLRPVAALALPLAAVLYALMTADSAWRHWRRRGGGWKARTYASARDVDGAA
jgi:hopene-associated glycosyltransferase HpnB